MMSRDSLSWEPDDEKLNFAETLRTVATAPRMVTPLEPQKMRKRTLFHIYKGSMHTIAIQFCIRPCISISLMKRKTA
jgi:hypothetical protein